MLRRGIIIKWEDEKGYGFIAPDDGGADLFLHHRAVVDRVRRPRLGDRVCYEVGQSVGKGPRAEKVTLRSGAAPSLAQPAMPPRSRTSRTPRRVSESFPGRIAGVLLVLLLPANVFGVLWLAASRHFIPPWVAILYLAMSTVTAIAYALDKFRAAKGKWRISEGTLHLFELAGGWPGAFAAQRILRHKTRKLSFQVVFWLIVLSHVAFWTWVAKRQMEAWR